MKYPITVFDDIGNEYPRKNLLLAEKSMAEGDGLSPEALAFSSEDVREYEILRTQALAAEKDFLEKVSERKKTFQESVEDADPKVRQWLIDSKESQARAEFYEPLIDLDYDFELEYKQHLEIAEQLPKIASDRRAMLEIGRAHV